MAEYDLNDVQQLIENGDAIADHGSAEEQEALTEAWMLVVWLSYRRGLLRPEQIRTLRRKAAESLVSMSDADLHKHFDRDEILELLTEADAILLGT